MEEVGKDMTTTFAAHTLIMEGTEVINEKILYMILLSKNIAESRRMTNKNKGPRADKQWL